MLVLAGLLCLWPEIVVSLLLRALMRRTYWIKGGSVSCSHCNKFDNEDVHQD